MPDALAKTLPPGAGVGFKHVLAEAALETDHQVLWFEVHAENYMGAGGPPHALLTRLRERFPLSLHGVGLSIGGEGRLDRDHLQRLRALVDRYQPQSFSEHLAWSSHGGVYFNDLLPLPYTAETARRVAAHVGEAQEAVGMRLLLENPSTYAPFEESDMAETDFLREVAAQSGCGLLLDVNNVHVSAANQGLSAEAYLDAFPLELVGELHLGGHAPDADAAGAALLIDAHDRAVDDAVWRLFARVVAGGGPRPTLIEWDNDVPDWPTLAAEAARAEAVLAEGRAAHAA
jgi:uncharacterized protein (UPF0276 family)